MNPFKILSFSLVAALVGCGGSDDSTDAGKTPATPRYAYVTNGVDPFWTLAETGAKDAAKELGVEVSVLMPTGGATEQKSMVEDLLSRGVDGVAVSPIDANNQTDFFNTVAQRVNLITHDSDAPASDRKAFIGVDNYAAGRLCGDLVKEALPEGGSIMIMIGRMEQDNARRRRQGVIDSVLDRTYDPSRFDKPGEVLKNEKYTILGTLTDAFDYQAAKANAEDTLARHPDIDAMAGLFAYNPPMILEALAAADKLGKVKVIGFDEAEATLEGIKAGTVYGTAVQNPYQYGYQSVKLLHSLHNGDESGIPADKFIHVEARQIRKADVVEFQADLKKKLGQ